MTRRSEKFLSDLGLAGLIVIVLVLVAFAIAKVWP